ncbi:SIMPL domain-containing protein [Parasphingorhabdus halotolerans]|uniref:SIMPL domain-containing protein n=1 Tax=Parasphingorhabdus halotolerans TaxID=2725558 RepID=A0A6H2DPX4_9SPHN|nr:SIMPL domain-containing protein [Parasphingorhabdus halotolerans]QJB70709.1 SIMPL domain-containing protein [Parasphingorhabdus halotolerans]
MSEETTSGKWTDKKNNVLLASAGLLTIGLIAGGYFMGDGLLRAKMADRSVTVRGLAERDVTADLATWTIAYSAQSSSLADAQIDIDGDTKAIGKFFTELGFKADALKPTGANVNQYDSNGIPQYTIRQRLSLRTDDIDKAQAAVARQFDLVRRGVVLEDGSGMSYTFTKLEKIKPEMVAEATKDARKSAEQFAKDSETNVGGIKSATQGYFSIESRDGDGGGYGVSDTPYKKVRVVTTVDFYLD